MKYDFDTTVDRKGSDCSKWDRVETVFGDKDILPMWVADMDFPIARPITDAIRKRTEHEIYGYTQPYESVIQSVIDRMKQKYNWEVEADWIVFTPGIVPAINAAIKAFTHPGNEVLIQEPVYHPFRAAIIANGCTPVNNQLQLINGNYEIDFDDLENCFNPKAAGMMPRKPCIRMLVLCNPHNPIGRVWSKSELTRIGEIVLGNGALIVSDEIHCELLFKGYPHIPFAAISEEFEQNSIICMAPSKTFNIAGLEASSLIIPNASLRERFNAAKTGIQPPPNIFGFVALEAAYRYGDEWLEQLLEYLEGNLNFLSNYFEEKIPEIKVIRPQGTYLVWLDCRQLGFDSEGLRDFMRGKAKVGLEDGIIFGPSGSGFQRMNIACTRAVLNEALSRIEQAVKQC